MLVSPHVSFDCGQIDKSAQAVPTLPASGGLRQRVLILSLSWLPLLLPGLIGGSRVFGASQERGHSKQVTSSCWGHRKHLSVASPTPFPSFQQGHRPEWHGPAGHRSLGFLDGQSRACWPGRAGLLSRQLGTFVFSSFITTQASLAHVKQVVVSAGRATGISQDGAR